MQTGIMVVADDDRIRLINDPAREMLGVQEMNAKLNRLHSISPPLAEELERWRNTPHREPPVFRVPATGLSLLPRFIHVGDDRRAGTLIFLDDTSVFERQTLQLKLAALGRLTAGIAHEIRNPLGAVSHAGQLLAESRHLGKEDERLVNIIQQHSRRINQLIEEVMQLGRRNDINRRDFELLGWAEEFGRYFVETQKLADNAVNIAGTPVHICFDPDQLHQVVFNLCENGVRHSPAYSGEVLLWLHAGTDDETHEPYLDVIDHGSGIPAEETDKIFEPFFTTSAKGTGLGLYIARELCAGNRAWLEYHPGEKGGARFRIRFATPSDCEIKSQDGEPPATPEQ
jgi:two-component system sensor histidine kinase PilS (NtrC family)